MGKGRGERRESTFKQRVLRSTYVQLVASYLSPPKMRVYRYSKKIWDPLQSSSFRWNAIEIYSQLLTPDPSNSPQLSSSPPLSGFSNLEICKLRGKWNINDWKIRSYPLWMRAIELVVLFNGETVNHNEVMGLLYLSCSSESVFSWGGFTTAPGGGGGASDNVPSARLLGLVKLAFSLLFPIRPSFFLIIFTVIFSPSLNDISFILCTGPRSSVSWSDPVDGTYHVGKEGY